MLRLDKFLCDAGIGSRSQVKVFLKQGLIKVKGKSSKSRSLRWKKNRIVLLSKGRK